MPLPQEGGHDRTKVPLAPRPSHLSHSINTSSLLRLRVAWLSSWPWTLGGVAVLARRCSAQLCLRQLSSAPLLLDDLTLSCQARIFQVVSRGCIFTCPPEHTSCSFVPFCCCLSAFPLISAPRPHGSPRFSASGHLKRATPPGDSRRLPSKQVKLQPPRRLSSTPDFFLLAPRDPPPLAEDDDSKDVVQSTRYDLF
jgi:hypothetical protein